MRGKGFIRIDKRAAKRATECAVKCVIKRATGLASCSPSSEGLLRLACVGCSWSAGAAPVELARGLRAVSVGCFLADCLAGLFTRWLACCLSG